MNTKLIKPNIKYEPSELELMTPIGFLQILALDTKEYRDWNSLDPRHLSLRFLVIYRYNMI